MTTIQHLTRSMVQLDDHTGLPLGYCPRTMQLKYKVYEGRAEGQILSVKVTKTEDHRDMREFFCK